MKTADILSMMAEIAPVIREYTSAVLDPVLKQVEELQTRVAGLSESLDKAVSAGLSEELSGIRSEVAALQARTDPDIAPVVRAQTAEALEPLMHRIAGLEERLTAVPDAIDRAVSSALSEELADIRGAIAAAQPAADLPEAVLDAIVTRVLSRVPVPKDAVGLAGAFIDRDGDLVVTLSDGRHQKLGPVVGKSVDERLLMQRLCGEAADAVEALKADVESAVQRVSQLAVPDIAAMIVDAVRALPAPPSLDEVRPLIEREVAKAVAQIPKPENGKDGRGLASMLIDRAGELVATMTDGRVEKLGPVVGRDGDDADWTAIEKAIADCVKALPKPRDGHDGLGFDDLDVTDDEEGVFLSFARGERTRRFRLPVVTDRGVFKAGTLYGKGNGVTWGGSYWIAQADTSDKPGETGAWRLAVKKGRDGKDAKS